MSVINQTMGSVPTLPIKKNLGFFKFPTAMSMTPEQTAKKFNTIQCIKKMQISVINSLYDECSDPIDYIKICPFMLYNEREMIYVYSIKFNTLQEETPVMRMFYKSTGSSRGDINIKNIWFPMSDVGFRKEFGGNGAIIGIVGKLEDEILVELQELAIPSPLLDHSVNKYCRFINRINTCASKVLMEMFETNPEFIEVVENLDDHSEDSVDNLLELYENKVCAVPMVMVIHH